MVLALDTNCLLRWLLEDNEEQAAVVDEHLRSSKARLHVADLAVAEAVWVLKKVYGFDDDLVVGLARKIIEHDKINCNRALFGPVLAELNKSPKVSFVDICLAYYADMGGAKLLTFDRTLAKRFPRMVKQA